MKCETCSSPIPPDDFHGDYYYCHECNANYSIDGLPEDSKEELKVTDEWLMIAHIMGEPTVIPKPEHKKKSRRTNERVDQH